jgi:hypothetical protein
VILTLNGRFLLLLSQNRAQYRGTVGGGRCSILGLTVVVFDVWVLMQAQVLLTQVVSTTELLTAELGAENNVYSDVELILIL